MTEINLIDCELPGGTSNDMKLRKGDCAVRTQQHEICVLATTTTKTCNNMYNVAQWHTSLLRLSGCCLGEGGGGGQSTKAETTLCARVC